MKKLLVEFPHASDIYGNNKEYFIDFMIEKYIDVKPDNIKVSSLVSKIAHLFAISKKIYFPYKRMYLCYDFTTGEILPKIFKKTDLNPEIDCILPPFWRKTIREENFFDYIEYVLSNLDNSSNILK